MTDTERRLRERLSDTQQKRAAERRVLKMLISGAATLDDARDVLKHPLRWGDAYYRRMHGLAPRVYLPLPHWRPQ